MKNRCIIDDEKISLAVSLLGGTALQWFLNLKLKNQVPSSWNKFKDKLKSQFQPIDFQENLRQQLLQLRQKHMDELTQVMLSVNGLSLNTSVYVRSKCPQTVEEAIREATTYDNVMAITSANVECNAINSRQPQQQRDTTPFTTATTKDDCFKFGLCFYCKEPPKSADPTSDPIGTWKYPTIRYSSIGFRVEESMSDPQCRNPMNFR
ncbi:unnamed protein product [Rotaria socialis]|uniref:Retrotransposon gag domain-containing protein n=1 Tax=Rotaria socialis TaxID=392032 RepID=A0A818V548_9BILA|nr:unnamed protein product [Rotaria socialis]